MALPGTGRDHYAQATLANLETQFLACLHDDDTEGRLLLDFHTSWSAFQEELESIQPHLTAQTKEKIEQFVTIMVTVSASMVDTTSTAIVDQLKADFSEILTQPAHHASSSRGSPRYIEDSLRWLKANIHNPYPSEAVRSSIARKAQASVKDVGAWFVDIRKRIGWSRMRQSRFGNRKAGIVDAATRFFIGSDPHRPLENGAESEFAFIAATVEQLYDEKCAGSTLASHLDQAVKDLTPELQKSLSKERRRVQSIVQHSKSPRHRAHPYPYPSPELSPTFSARTLCTPEPSVLDFSPLDSPERRNKRLRSSSDAFSSDDEEDTVRTTKRSRRSIEESHLSAKRSSSPDSSNPSAQLACYPSPAASVAMMQPELPVEQHILPEAAPTNAGKRKRTLSDAGIARPPPSRESESQPSTSSYPSPLSVNEILDQAVISSAAPCSLSASSIVQQGAYNPYNAFAALFAAFTGTGTDAISATSSQPLTQLPLLNLVDDVPPANVHVEYDQSWSLDYNADDLAPSIDTSITGYNINFEDFGSNLYSDSTDLLGGPTQQWGSFWLANPSQESYASASSSRSNASSLPVAAPPAPSTTIDSLPAPQLYLPAPSPASAYHCLDIPAEGLRQPYPLSDPQTPGSSYPLARLTDKAKELMVLEARCAALRNELVSVC